MLDMPCGPQMVDRIRRAWDHGDAVFPLDQRAPQAMRQLLVSAAGPTRIATVNDETSWKGQPVEPGDALVVATSGTTGQPKCVILTTEALLTSARATHSFLEITSDDSWLCCLPPSHMGGFGVLARALLTDTSVMAIPAFSVDAYNQAALLGATRVSLVPTALQRVDTSVYRTILVGGSRPPSDMPDNCIATYGLTETGGGIVYRGMPLADVQLEIRKEIVHIKAPMMMRQFRDGSDPFTHDGWLPTGDMGVIDSSGKLQVHGRHGDLIISGGENVWPTAVEDILLRHRAVTDVCVAGVPDPTWGHVVTAWIVSDSSETVSLEEIREHVKEFLPSYCAPQKIVITDQIPRTTLGKPQRNILISSLETQ